MVRLILVAFVIGTKKNPWTRRAGGRALFSPGRSPATPGL
jgi:hypothetical protein